jgi:hypothetical protein
VVYVVSLSNAFTLLYLVKSKDVPVQPWRHVGGIEVFGCFTPGEGTPVHIEWGAGWAPALFWTFWKREHLFGPHEDLNPNRRYTSLGIHALLLLTDPALNKFYFLLHFKLPIGKFSEWSTDNDILQASMFNPIQWKPVSLWGAKRPGGGFNHPSPSRAKVKERVELYFTAPLCLHIRW